MVLNIKEKSTEEKNQVEKWYIAQVIRNMNPKKAVIILKTISIAESIEPTTMAINILQGILPPLHAPGFVVLHTLFSFHPLLRFLHYP